LQNVINNRKCAHNIKNQLAIICLQLALVWSRSVEADGLRELGLDMKMNSENCENHFTKIEERKIVRADQVRERRKH